MKGSESSSSSVPGFPAAVRWILAALSLALPFLFLGSLGDPFQLPKQQLFRWGAVLVLGVWLWGTLASGRVSFRRTRVSAPLFLLMFLALLSVFQAPNPAEASSAVRDMAFCALIFFLSLSALAASPGGVAASLSAGAALTAALGTLQLLLGPRLSILPPTQGGALTGDVTTGAMFVAALLPLMLGMMGTRSPGGTWLWAAGSGVSLAYVALSRSRAAWLGALAGLVTLAVVSLRRSTSEEEGPRLRRGPALGVLVLAAVLCITGSTFGKIDLLSSAPSLKTVELQGPHFRIYTWQATLRMIFAHPLGVGAGSWRRELPMVAGNLAPEYPFNSSRLPQSTGNEYLEMAAELGVAGLLLFLWFLARLISPGMKSGPLLGGIGAGAVASVVSLAACGLFASPLREQPTLLAATLVAALAVTSRAEEGSAGPRELAWEMVQRRKPWIAVGAVLLFTALLVSAGWNTYRSYVASAALQQGQSAWFRGDYATALPALLGASEMEESSSLVRYLTGSCALAAGRYDLAETELRAAQSLNPQDAATLLALASSLRAKGNLLDAAGICERARKIWPRDEAVNLALGDLRSAMGDFEGSLEAYRTALKGNPYSVTAYLKMGSLMESSNKKNGAVGSYSKAANLDPYLPEALARLGTAYMKQGNYDAAIPNFSAILVMNPDDVPAMVNLARLLSGLERPCDAVPLLEKARDLDSVPSHRAQLEQALPDLIERCRKSRPSPR